MHGVLFWIGALVLYLILGGILSVFACSAPSHEVRRVLGSFQVWVIYRLIWWTLLAFVACAIPTFLALIVFTALEWIFDACVGDSFGWCGRPSRDRGDCDDRGRRNDCGEGFNDCNNWRNSWGNGPLFWSRLFYDFVVGLVGIAIGAGFLPLCYLSDGTYGAMESWAVWFWVGAGLIAIFGTLLYHFFARHATTGDTKRVLEDYRTQLIIQLGYLLILGVLSGAPIYIFIIWIIIWEVLDWFLGWCCDSFREPGWKSLDAIVYGMLAVLIGAELIRPLLDRNMNAAAYA